MSPEKLVYMANQIATFFNTQPAMHPAERIAAHLRDYWEPRMISTLATHAATGAEELDPNVTEALSRLEATRPFGGD